MRRETDQDELVADCVYGAGDVLVQRGMARLEDGSVVFLAPDEDVRGVDMSDVEDGVNGDFN